ncbi:MAG: HD-GYP domain-containing protein [Phycisphaerae bacterium]
MASPFTCRKNGLRLHCFVAGAVPMAAYLADWASPVWIALGLSAAALVSVRLAVVARLYDFFKTPEDRADAEFHYGVHRFNEAVRVGLLGLGLGLLLTGYPFGWLPILGASATALLEAATGFSVTALIYAGAIVLAGRQASAEPKPFEPTAGRLNPDCLVCRALGRAPYQRCRWCHLPSVRWCYGLQASMLLMLLLVIAFLLDSPLGPFATKALVAMSILAVVALGLAINRQTDDLVSALDNSFEKGEREEWRCAFLKRLAMADSVEAAAQVAIDYAGEAVGARRISVRIAEEGALRIQALCAGIGRELGLSEERLQALSCAAELHDIGTLAIPDRILRAERPLTDTEWVLVRQHPLCGIQLIEHISFLKLAKPIMLRHHERIDGSGYPDGCSGDEIPLESKILAVVDSYNAMTSARPYRPPLTHEAAVAELRRCAGTQFDVDCVETFLGLLSREDAESAPISIGAGEAS